MADCPALMKRQRRFRPSCSRSDICRSTSARTIPSVHDHVYRQFALHSSTHHHYRCTLLVVSIQTSGTREIEHDFKIVQILHGIQPINSVRIFIKYGLVE